MKINIDKFIEITNKYMYKTTCSICGKEHTVIPDSVEVEDDGYIFFNIDCEDHRSEYCGTSFVKV